jgi:hypothetical protein
MKAKLFASLAPLLAIAAFAVVPAAAQAEPHWYKKLALIGTAPVTTTTSGTLTLNALGSTIVCKLSDAEEIWNPTGGPGVDLVTSFVLSPCKNKVASPVCPKGSITVKAEALPWPSRLVSTPPPSSVIRDEIVGVKLLVGCAGSSGTVGDEFTGTLSPEVGNGVLVFGGPGGGTLFDPGANPLTVTGKDKIVAPKGKVTAKDP